MTSSAMASGPNRLFSDKQQNLIRSHAQRVFEQDFSARPKPQYEFGQALDAWSQASVSSYLSGQMGISPGRAETLARLAGFASLRDMIGEYPAKRSQMDTPEAQLAAARFPNLQVCVDFFGADHWPAWVSAVADAGFWKEDCGPQEWAQRLNDLQSHLSKFPRRL